jgi:formylglycine-generating enzyme
MDARDALLAALHADPADAVAWLALADWLDENGESPRAELLRLHHSLPHLRPGRQRLAVENRIQAMLVSGVRPCVPVLTNSLGLQMALIPAGTFRMGSPPREVRRMNDEVLHDVRISRPFYLGVYPVTQAEFHAVTRRKPSNFKRGNSLLDEAADADRFPVETVTWTEAVAFCSRLSKRTDEKKAKHTYRLPTEAEWEYACRAWGSPDFPFHFGKTLERPEANFESEYPYPPNSRKAKKQPSLNRPCEVGRYAPNAFGLYDVHGNVDEWVSDYFEDEYYRNCPVVDPQGPAEGWRRVVRGGSWSGQGVDCRAAVRIGYDEDYSDNEIGFRVAMTVAT